MKNLGLAFLVAIAFVIGILSRTLHLDLLVPPVSDDEHNALASPAYNARLEYSETSFKVPKYNKTLAKEFTDKWCDLRGLDDSWFASDFKLRAPLFILPGAKKSGTTSLSSYIMQHPYVLKARRKELHTFWERKFREFENDAGIVNVKAARESMYQKDYKTAQIQLNASLLSFDGTPQYLFESYAAPKRILCTVPWVKIVVLLRNPVDRTYSNYAFHKRRQGFHTQFEPYIEQDFQTMKEAGLLLDDPEEQKTLYNTPKEDKAWRRYHSIRGEGAVGRSLYAIGLSHFFKAFQSIGRDPYTEFHIVRTEDMERDLDGEYQKILEFLGLPYYRLENTQVKVKTNYSSPMKAETRQRLEKFFEPYNQRLYELLGNDFVKW
jgi:hypothetical protein